MPASVTVFRQLYHMPVEGTDWQQWRARMWNQIADRVRGHPRLSPLEQWMLRSRKEQRCVECGEEGTIKCLGSPLVPSVSHYFMCQECDTYYKEKHADAS